MRIIDKKGIDRCWPILEPTEKLFNYFNLASIVDERENQMNSTAGTGHFYTTDKNKRSTPISWK